MKETYSRKNSTLNEIEQNLINLVSRDNSLIQSEMMTHLNSNNTNTNISQPTISRKLKKIKFTRKLLSLIPIERNSQANIDIRFNYSNDISRFPFNNLIFLDECGINFHTKRHYEYSSHNTPAFINVPGNRGVNLSYNVCYRYLWRVGI
jgi:hypothetical protein